MTTFGNDFATTNAVFNRTGWLSSKSGRQSQSLVKVPGREWQIVSAHVSIVDLEK
ncbi:AtzH-like domain-containing protein [uncultured Marinobacter sp.]|uniref:AtzH-like domain-containing protein n=1 Tax=uncultured Marinobacter sp. TaxID=187379 RepID=UPI00338F31CE